MKHIRLQLSAIVLISLGLTSLQSQTMYVNQSNGTQTTFALSNARKLTFSSGNLTYQKKDNTTRVYALSGLRYLSFKYFTTGIAEQVKSGNTHLITYPNPISDLLNVDLTGSEYKYGSISILSLEGKVMQKQVILGTGIVTLNLTQLPQGFYLCRYSNGTEIKTEKIIKQ